MSVICILRLVTLYNQLGRYKKPMQLIDQRKFHPWEGGEGKLPVGMCFAGWIS